MIAGKSRKVVLARQVIGSLVSLWRHRLTILTHSLSEQEQYFKPVFCQGRELRSDTISSKNTEKWLILLVILLPEMMLSIETDPISLILSTFSSLFYSLKESYGWYPASESGLFPFQICHSKSMTHPSALSLLISLVGLGNCGDFTWLGRTMGERSLTPKWLPGIEASDVQLTCRG